MKKNIGPTDRIIRLVLAIILAAVYFFGAANGLLTATISLALLGGVIILTLTALISFCPVYLIFGNSKADDDPHKSGVCCGSCGGEDSGDAAEVNDGPPKLT